MKSAAETIPNEYVIYNGLLIKRTSSKRPHFVVVAKPVMGTMFSNSKLNQTKEPGGSLSVRFEYIRLDPDTKVTTLVDL